jgi:MOSC domain-containing protein YiiM
VPQPESVEQPLSDEAMTMPPHIEIPVLSLHVGQATVFGPKGEPSAIHKQPVSGLLDVTKWGLAGDEQADARHHGGHDKALHHYPREHYPAWRRDLPQQAGLFVPGGFGENLSTLSLDESMVCVGDVFEFGTALIQVSQGRRPCWKLNARFGVADMVQRVQELGRTGWYYRVLRPGQVAAGDHLRLVDRPCWEWPLARVWRLLHQTAPDPDSLALLADLQPLARGWRETARKRIGSVRG